MSFSFSTIQVHKARDPDKEMYSAFGDNDTPCEDGCKALKEILSDVDTMHVYVCGLAYDICVKETCLDGLRLGYRLAVVDDCCRGAYPSNTVIAKKLISENDGLIACSDRVLSLVNEGKRSLVMAHQGAKRMIQKESLERSNKCSFKHCHRSLVRIPS